MQVSIYLDEGIVRFVDQKAKKARKSRSEFIQSVLKAVLLNKREKTIFDGMFGTWDRETADEMLRIIRHSRRDSPRFA